MPTQPTSARNELTDTAPNVRTYLRMFLRSLWRPVLFLVAGVLLVVFTGIAQRAGWLASGAGDQGRPGDASEVADFTFPLPPQIRQPDPGRCPICGMELVPASSAGGSELDELSLRIEPAQRRLAGIQTMEVRRGLLHTVVQSVGAIAIDESRTATISSYVRGRIERLFADYTGVSVAKGDHLAVVYSPELYSAQVEYLEARETFAAMPAGALAVARETQQSLVTNARRRLEELGMAEEQLRSLEDSGEALSRLTIYAPLGGTVVEKLAIEGAYVETGEPIYRIADLSTVWLMLELFPEDASRIRFGQRVEARMQSLPGEIFEGRVAFIDPVVDPQKRTVGVRVEFLNEDRRLRPGDYSAATIHVPLGTAGAVYDADLAGRWISPMHPQIIRDEPGVCPICGMELVPTSEYGYTDAPLPQPESLYVPRQALLMAGSSSVVYVEVEPGRFEIRPVTIGPILRDIVVILKGLSEGEKVATAGNFLIDSQMQLAGKPSLIDPERAVAAQKGRELRKPSASGVVATLDGQPGQKIEALYDAYFAVQRDLAQDERPNPKDAEMLHDNAQWLADHDDTPAAATGPLRTIARHSEHLHHLDLVEARHDAFRPISHAVLTLAASVRGEFADEPFTHVFCSMVKGGGGDWLQPGGTLSSADIRNPYWGSEMLHCGELVDVFPPTPSNTRD